jgi:hypothetical protein
LLELPSSKSAPVKVAFSPQKWPPCTLPETLNGQGNRSVCALPAARDDPQKYSYLRMLHTDGPGSDAVIVNGGGQNGNLTRNPLACEPLLLRRFKAICH